MVVSVSQDNSGQLWRRDLEDEGVGGRGVQWLACLARGLLRRTDTSLPVTSSMATMSFLVCPLDFQGGSLEVSKCWGTVPNVLAHAQLKVNDYCDHSLF